jgi:hypothetical protein
MSDTAPTSAPAPNAAPAAPSAPSSPAPQGGATSADTPPSTAGGYKAFVDASNAKRAERIARDAKERQQQQPPKAAAPATVPGPQNPSPSPQAGEQPIEGEQPPVEDPNAPPQWTEELAAKLKKYDEWMNSDTIPEEFLAKLVALKNGDVVEYESFEEMRKERMMQSDYSREMGKIKQERAQWESERRAYQQHFESIGHPETGGEAMYEIFTRNGWRKQGRQMAEKYAAEEREDNLHAQGYAIAFAQQNRIYKQNAQGQWDVDWDHYDVRKAYDKARGERERQRERDDKERGRDFEIERLRGQQQQQQQQTKVDEDVARMTRQLDQLRPRFMEARGLDKDDATHKVAFNEQLHAILSLEGVQITPDVVSRAAKAAKQVIDKREKAGGAPPPPTQQPFVPRRGGGAAPIANQQGGPQGGWHIGNFQQKHGRR